MRQNTLWNPRIRNRSFRVCYLTNSGRSSRGKRMLYYGKKYEEKSKNSNRLCVKVVLFQTSIPLPSIIIRLGHQILPFLPTNTPYMLARVLATRFSRAHVKITDALLARSWRTNKIINARVRFSYVFLLDFSSTLYVRMSMVSSNIIMYNIL